MKKIGWGENEIDPNIHNSEGKRWMYTGGQDYKRLRGRAMRRRDKAISDTLKQVHKPYEQRSIENAVSNDGTILFDLT